MAKSASPKAAPAKKPASKKPASKKPVAKKPAPKKPTSKSRPGSLGGPPAGSLAAELTSSKPARGSKAPVAYSFVVDALEDLDPVVRPMFGAHAVYVGERIVLILRKRDSGRQDNGVWLATTAEHHASLRGDFPALRSITVLQDPAKPEPSGWQMIPADDDAFDESVARVVAMIRRADPRIGKVPAGRKKKPAKKP